MKEISNKNKLAILCRDSWLQPYEQDLLDRVDRYRNRKIRLLNGKSLCDFSNGYMYYGLHREANGWVYREWAPHADALFLTGSFNGWNRYEYPLTSLGNGDWEIHLQGKDKIHHQDYYQVIVRHDGRDDTRIPLYANEVVQNEHRRFCAKVWEPDIPFAWNDHGFSPKKNIPPLIYECHIGMATEEYRFGTYEEFRVNVLPYIRQQGYNTLQIMAIMQHPYYGSFGYQVGSFFAPSSWYGNPDELKHLIADAHGMGISVLLDLVHSHAAKNTEEGINCFDGTTTQFFKSGMAGHHPAWDSMVFDYGNDRVVHFLLSNIKYWIEEFHFDGFRFDGVTSMLYHNHGLEESFTDYRQYFSMNTDVEAVSYLQLACELTHSLKDGSLCIAEDMSGMPGLCLKPEEGGIGFDYRLNMGIPDLYIRYLKEKHLGDWPMGSLFFELSSHRSGEKGIAYTESHDQALVGDKTLIFRMADQAMYTSMDKGMHEPTLENAIAMHKLLRLITIAAGGMGYLNFMGNEFGHPEWIDFPREGNGWSFHYARRQWSLVHNPFLRYGDLARFDEDMLRTIQKHEILKDEWPRFLREHQKNQLLIFERNHCIFAFNFHPERSEKTCYIPTPEHGKWQIVLSTDDTAYGGYGNIDSSYVYETAEQPDETGGGFCLYLPALTGVMLVMKQQAAQTAMAD